MRKKFIAVAIVLLIAAFIFTGCGGGANQGGTNGNNNKPAVAQLIVTVKDDAGNTLSGVTVSLNSENEKSTDSSGKVIFDSLKPGDYEVKAEKEGYEPASDDVTLKEGDKQTLNLVLKREAEQVEEAKKFSDLKSYKAIVEFTSNDDNDNGKIVLIQDNYGKEKHITIYGKDGKVQFELYVVGNKAKMRSDNEKWTEIPSTAAEGLTGSTLGFAEGMMNNTVSYFNEAAEGKNERYSIKRVGSETVNGYPTYKYHLIAEGGTGENKGSVVGDIWIIRKGPYKDYTTRMILKYSDASGVKTTFTANLVDIGKNMQITLP
jgi:hypothetical protein